MIGYKKHLLKMNFPSVTGKAAVALLLIVIFSVACQAHNTYSMKGKYRWRAGKRSYNFRDSLEKKMPSYSNMLQGIQQYPLQDDVPPSSKSLKSIVTDLRNYCDSLLQLLDELDVAIPENKSE